MDALSIITLAMGAAWASGINLYATVLLVGLLGTFGLVPLPDGLSPLTSPIVLGVAGVAYVIEFFADKIPGLDSIWDGIHTFIRIPAGAAMAAGATAGLGEDYMVALALLGGAAVAAGSHATKAGSRAVINTSPEPVTNWAASFFEDVLVVVGLLLALFKPAVFLIFVLVFFLAALWLLPKIWRGLRRLHQRFAGKQGPDAIADQRPGFELSSLDRND
ncbi:MAG: DUF4126 domain-containing protein [Rhodospirillaceae bacterium]|nr:DUF4126 domain-containing protein [Rhodospirillaceae bacterium]